MKQIHLPLSFAISLKSEAYLGSAECKLKYTSKLNLGKDPVTSDSVMGYKAGRQRGSLLCHRHLASNRQAFQHFLAWTRGDRSGPTIRYFSS